MQCGGKNTRRRDLRHRQNRAARAKVLWGMNTRFLLAQISDTHARAGVGDGNVANLKRALDGARAHGADAIMMTGDLANDARAEEYELLVEALHDPPAPLFLLPGNHDDRALMRRFFPGHAYFGRDPDAGLSYVIDDFPVRLVALDQIVPGQTHGMFTPELEAWLDAALSNAPRKPTLIALHHQAFETLDRLFDTIGLHEAERFARVVARHPQVGRIICGHHHRAVVGQVAQVPAVAAPSTAWTFGLALEPNQRVAQRTHEPPGWALHGWSADGGFVSHFMSL